MAACKIVLLFIIFQLVNSKPSPFKEFHIKKNFEFKFKPPPHRPITFIKEKFTKFGHFSTKHVIMKRSPFELAQIPEQKEPDTVFRVSLEKSMEAGSPIPLITPLPPSIVTPYPPPPPKPISVPPPAVTILPSIKDPLSRLPVEEILIVTPIPPPPPPPVSVPPPPPPPPPPPVIVPTPILPSSPAPVPVPGPPVPVSPVPLPPPAPKNVVQGNLLTDIARVDEINAYLKAVESLSPPPVEPLLQGNVLPVVTGNSIETDVKAPVEEKPGPLVKGSRLALYFGNILLQVMSEVISSARSAISQYSQPAPF